MYELAKKRRKCAKLACRRVSHQIVVWFMMSSGIVVQKIIICFGADRERRVSCILMQTEREVS